MSIAVDIEQMKISCIDWWDHNLANCLIVSIKAEHMCVLWYTNNSPKDVEMCTCIHKDRCKSIHVNTTSQFKAGSSSMFVENRMDKYTVLCNHIDDGLRPNLPSVLCKWGCLGTPCAHRSHATWLCWYCSHRVEQLRGSHLCLKTESIQFHAL